MKYIKLSVKLGIILILATLAIPGILTAPAMADEQRINIEPDHGPVGTEVHVHGSSFTPSVMTDNQTPDTKTLAKVYFQEHDATLVQTAFVDAEGNFETSFVVSQCAAGTHSILGHEWTTAQQVWVIATFTVEPKIELSKFFSYIGDNITVTGTGFAASSNITIHFDGSEVATTVTDQNGSFTRDAVTIPVSNNGSHEVKVVDASNNQSTTEFITKQQATISPTSGPIGEEVTISGTGFAATSNTTIFFDGSEVTSALTDDNGSFTGKFSVPSGTTDTCIVEASDGTNNMMCTFTVVDVPGGKMNRIIGYVGSDVTFTGIGFIPDRIAIIYYDAIQVAEATVNANGNLSASFKIPVSSGGEHTVSATDGTNKTECTFTMESTAPLAPVPLQPANASKVKPEARFAWEGVTDPSGVTYNLQIVFDDSFTTGNPASLVLEKSKLTTTEYILTLEEKLKPTRKGAYHWRVRAIDNASNAGSWSTVQEFYVGNSSPLVSPWVLYCLIVEAGIFIFFIGYWLVKRLYQF